MDTPNPAHTTPTLPQQNPTQLPHAARRLETLSDIVFGLAMTFLVSRLPVPGPNQPAPSLTDLYALLGQHLFAMVMSFCIATLYWFGHHRRLALAPPPGAAELALNFVFLLLIMLLPQTTDLYGRYGSAGSVRPLYCAHLGLLSLLNLVLWCLTIRDSRRPIGPDSAPRPGANALPWRAAAAPAFGVTVFTLATTTALYAPALCKPILYSAFLTPLINRAALSTRRRSPHRRSPHRRSPGPA